MSGWGVAPFSWRLAPVSVGTSFCRPAAKASKGDPGSTRPSTTTPKRKPPAGGRGRRRQRRGQRLHEKRGDRQRRGALGARERNAELLLVGERARTRTGRHAGAALGDGAMEQALGERRGDQAVSVGGAGRLPAERDVVRIAAERGDVIVDPAQRRDPIHQRVVARGASGFPRQLGMVKKPSTPSR